MTAILGISAFYHDSAAALIIDGQVVAAAQEERFTRIKHDARLPEKAIEYCLSEGRIQAAELDQVVYYEKPLLKFERLLETYLASVPRGYLSFRRAIPIWMREKLHLSRSLRQGLSGFRKRLTFVEHHEAHAASAFFPSPFDEAAILTVDGVGEWATACMGRGQENRIELTRELRFPHSLGLLYSAFTGYCGFRVNSGEYKLMGLAPYGDPIYVDTILSHLVDIHQDGSIRLDMRFFDYCEGLTMTNHRFHRLFGGPPRLPESPISQREMDLAASIQMVTEMILLRMAEQVYRLHPSKNLVMAGGVALNCVANGRLLREGPFEHLWVQPSAGDAGGALGAAWFVWHQLLNRPRTPHGSDRQQGSMLGPAFEEPLIRSALDAQNARYHYFSSKEEYYRRVAELIDQGMVVGWFQGRMEFGPRALGARSILADARRSTMQSTLNQKIKFRESFRPFAPAVLIESAEKYFDMPHATESPYMMLVGHIQPSQRVLANPDEPVVPTEESTHADSRVSERLRRVKSTLPAVTHVDHSARVQTVDKVRHPELYRLMQAFEIRTGCPVLINTSFNVRGEPIVCTPSDAYRCFMMTDMDALAIGDFLLFKSEQPVLAEPSARSEYLRSFSKD